MFRRLIKTHQCLEKRMISVHSNEAFENIKPEYSIRVVLVSSMYRIELEIIHKQCKIGRLEVTTDFSKIYQIFKLGYCMNGQF